MKKNYLSNVLFVRNLLWHRAPLDTTQRDGQSNALQNLLDKSPRRNPDYTTKFNLARTLSVAPWKHRLIGISIVCSADNHKTPILNLDRTFSKSNTEEEWLV